MKTEIISDNIHRACEILLSGGLVAVPTETVYGLAGNGLDEAAVEKIYRVKGRPGIKPLSLMVAGPEAMEKLCIDIPPAAVALAEKFWPGPLTIVLPASPVVPGIVRAGGKTVGLRCPDHPLTLELLRRCAVPLAAPSANPSDRPSPKNEKAVLDYFDGRIEALLSGGECGIGRESTIIDMSAAPYRILRAGALPEEEIFRALRDDLNIVGITGGTGCGKTTALNVLKEMGALVIDADALYHELTSTDRQMRDEICARFGEVYKGSELDRKALGNVVFSDPDALLDLNRITHKYVDGEISRRLARHALRGGRLAAIDAIALLEGAYAKKTLFNLAVLAPRQERLRRLMQRENISEEYAQKRIDAQKSDSYFEKNCDHVLYNDGTKQQFEDKCKKFFTEVLKNVR